MRTENKVPLINKNLFDVVEQYVFSENNGCSIIVPHVCNNINLFGAGFAAATAKHYPIVKANYHMLANKQTLGYTQFVSVAENKRYGHKLIFANMIAQNNTMSRSNMRPLNYGALTKCMFMVSQYITQNFDKENPVQIHAPKFGSGLAGGNWNFISDLIKDIWFNQTVFIYDINQKTRI